MLFLFAGIAVVLTFLMFHTKNMMLGFPSAIFWALLGGHAYTLYTVIWDIEYLLFFASFGMVIFCMYAAFALRKTDIDVPKKDWIESVKFLDENGKKGGEPDYMRESKDEDKYIDEGSSSRRTRELHHRAEDRRTGNRRKTSWGEFR